MSISGQTLHYSTSTPIPVQPDNPLTTLIRRLEAATSRLEDIASSSPPTDQAVGSGQNGATATAAAAAGGSILHSPQEAASKAGTREGSTGTVVREQLPPAIEAMDALINADVKAFVDASKGLDSVVEEQAALVAKAFADQRRFLVTASKSKKPDTQSKAFMDLLTDLQQDMSGVSDIKDSHRGSPMKEHFAMVGEGIAALQWLVMEGKPADYVGEVVGGAQMYGNRVLKTHKEGDQAHVKYVRSYYSLLKALLEYIKKHYPSGLTWNNNGADDALAVYRDADAASYIPNGVPRTPSAGGGPPPPPPPPLPTFDNAPPPPPPGPAPSNKAPGGDMGAVFEQLNRGESVTAGLKKVDKSQMTHKNPSLRAGSSVPDKSPSGDDISRSRSPGPQIKPKPASMRQNSTASTKTGPDQQQLKREPKKELDGNKWLIENFDSPSSPIEIEVSLTQSILITRCTKTTIILKGKANALSIDNSPKTQLLVENLVSAIDVIKCPGFAVQVTGALPTIMLDQVDGASIYLGKESLGTEVFTSKCSSVNVVLPPEGGDEEGDSRECPLPEQMRTVVREGRLVTEIVEHAG